MSYYLLLHILSFVFDCKYKKNQFVKWEMYFF